MSVRGIRAVAAVERTKLIGQLTPRLTLAACATGPFAFCAALRLQDSTPSDTLFGRAVMESGFAAALVVLGFAALWVIPALASLAGGDVFSAEDRHRTWPTLLTRSRSRAELFVAKVLVALTFSCLASRSPGGEQPRRRLARHWPPRAHRSVGSSQDSVAVAASGRARLGLRRATGAWSDVFRGSVVDRDAQRRGRHRTARCRRVDDATPRISRWTGSRPPPAAHIGVRRMARDPDRTALLRTGSSRRDRQRHVRPCLPGGGVPRAATARLRPVVVMRRMTFPVFRGIFAAATAVGMCACGASPISPSRIEQAIAPTFANLVQVQVSRLGLAPMAAAQFNVTASCRKTKMSAGASDAGSGDWVCTLRWKGPDGQSAPRYLRALRDQRRMLHRHRRR